MADVSTPSGEYVQMQDVWRLISDIQAGAVAIRAAGERYLPKYESEVDAEYRRRRMTAPWRPEFTDALRALASKPFTRDVGLKDPVNERIKAIAEDVDGRGNNITAFARETFVKGIAKGAHAILVDYPTMEPNATRAQESAAGARPYWIQIPVENIIALYTAIEGGREIITHVRIRESVIERDGYDEVEVHRIRVLEPGRWELWEKRANENAYTLVDRGEIRRGAARSVPLVLFFTGEREGVLRVRPPLADLGQLQIELYQALSRQDEILTFAGSPMLCAQGLAEPPAGVPVEVGPKRVLFAPPGVEGVTTGWNFVQPAAANITEIRAHVTSIIDDMRRLGMQPLTQRTGSPTATGQSIEAAKAHSAVQAWAIGLKDALEQALVYTSEWMGVDASAEIDVSTDFGVVPFAEAPLNALESARTRRDISQDTYWNGLKRFDVLPADFDGMAERDKLAAEPKPTPPAPPNIGMPRPEEEPVNPPGSAVTVDNNAPRSG